MSDSATRKQDLVVSENISAATANTRFDPYKDTLTGTGDSDAALSNSVGTRRWTRIGLFSIAYGMWAVLGCLIGMVLLGGVADGKVAETVAVLLLVSASVSIAVLLFGQLACFFSAMKSNAFKSIGIALGMEALGFVLFYIREWILVEGSVADGLGFIQGMANLVALVAFLFYVRQVASNSGYPALVNQTEKVTKLVMFALISLECFNLVVVYFPQLFGPLTPTFGMIVGLAQVVAFCKFFEIVWKVAWVTVSEPKEKISADAGLADKQNL